MAPIHQTVTRRPSTAIARLIFACSYLMRVGAQLAAQPASPAPEYVQPESPLLRWGGVLFVLIGIWFILYKVIYPFFLRYYEADFCKTIFWTLFILYSLTWLLLSSYLVLDFGFYYDWMKWVAAFLGVLWLISGLGLLLRRNPA